MPTVYDIAWKALLTAAAPAVALSPKFRRKANRAFRERMGQDLPVAPPGSGPAVMVHAVSLGEINATRLLVAQLRAARPGLRILVTVTTDTGFARGKEMYGSSPDVTLARFPLDLSPAIDRLFQRQRPGVVALMELEVWPNFALHCQRRGVPLTLINGRLTESSFKQYRRGGAIVRGMFRRLARACVQDAEYADRFKALGVPPDRVTITGNMKFDTAHLADRIPGDVELAAEVGLRPGLEPIWVCGSTGPGEERIVLSAYRQLLRSHQSLRLVIVPRHPERFDEVATLIETEGFPVRRRSGQPLAVSPKTGPEISDLRSQIRKPVPVILGDTMGELRKFYSLAMVVFAGRSLVDLGMRQRGSDMIEPAALAKPVVVGPWTHNFADAIRQFRAADAMSVVDSPTRLVEAVGMSLVDPSFAKEQGQRAQQVVRSQQGATARHVEMILGQLDGLP